MRVRAHKSDPWLEGVGLFLGEKHEDGGFSVAEPIVWKRYKPYEFAGHIPSIDLSHADALALMNTLWDCGYRPTEGSGSAGALAATQNHLSDLRAIVGKTLAIEFKK